MPVVKYNVLNSDILVPSSGTHSQSRIGLLTANMLIDVLSSHSTNEETIYRLQFQLIMLAKDHFFNLKLLIDTMVVRFSSVWKWKMA